MSCITLEECKPLLPLLLKWKWISKYSLMLLWGLNLIHVKNLTHETRISKWKELLHTIATIVLLCKIWFTSMIINVIFSFLLQFKYAKLCSGEKWFLKAQVIKKNDLFFRHAHVHSGPVTGLHCASSPRSESGPHAGTGAATVQLLPAEGKHNDASCKCRDTSDFRLKKACFTSHVSLAGARHRITFKGNRSSILPIT